MQKTSYIGQAAQWQWHLEMLANFRGEGIAKGTKIDTSDIDVRFHRLNKCRIKSKPRSVHASARIQYSVFLGQFHGIDSISGNADLKKAIPSTEKIDKPNSFFREKVRAPSHRKGLRSLGDARA